MQLRPILISLSLAFAVAAASAQTAPPPTTAPAPTSDKSFTLKRKAKAGDELKYKLTLQASVGGAEGTLTSSATDKVKTFPDAGNYTLQETWTDSKIVFAGGEQEGPKIDAVLEYTPANELVSITGPEVDDNMKALLFRLIALRDFRAPDKAVKVGDTWSVENKATAANGNVSSKLDYKADGEEKLGAFQTLRVKLTGKETGGGEATSEMTIWVDETDGSIVKIEGTLLKLPLPDVPVPVDAKITYVREGA